MYIYIIKYIYIHYVYGLNMRRKWEHYQQMAYENRVDQPRKLRIHIYLINNWGCHTKMSTATDDINPACLQLEKSSHVIYGMFHRHG